MIDESKQVLPSWTRTDPARLRPDPAVQDFVASAHRHIAYSVSCENGFSSPTYGLLSQHARQIAVAPYGLPTIKKHYAKSFVDGSSTIFVSDDLIARIALEEAATRGVAKGLEPLILLQQMRILMNHVGRLTTLSDGTPIPEDIAQIAGETSAYCKLRIGFPNMQWVPCISDDIAASLMSEPRLQFWATKAEEEIAKQLLMTCSKVRHELGRRLCDTKVLLHALAHLNMAPKLCVHNTCRDTELALVAIADQERADLLRVTRRKRSHDRKFQSLPDSAGMDGSAQIPPVDKRGRL